MRREPRHPRDASLSVSQAVRQAPHPRPNRQRARPAIGPSRADGLWRNRLREGMNLVHVHLEQPRHAIAPQMTHVNHSANSTRVNVQKLCCGSDRPEARCICLRCPTTFWGITERPCYPCHKTTSLFWFAPPTPAQKAHEAKAERAPLPNRRRCHLALGSPCNAHSHSPGHEVEDEPSPHARWPLRGRRGPRLAQWRRQPPVVWDSHGRSRVPLFDRVGIVGFEPATPGL